MAPRNFRNNQMVTASKPFDNRFRVICKVMASSEVYICFDLQLNKEVVLKAEEIGRRKPSLLQKEINFYEKLSTNEEFNIVLDSFIGIDHRFLVMEKRGLDLRLYYKKLVKVGQWKDSFLDKYAVQMIDGLQKCHSFGIIHLDPKPSNYVLDAKDVNKIYLIDFDCGKQYIDTNGEHIPHRKGLPSNQVFGNRYYISMNGHNFEEQSRRDDMIFLGYSFIWMARNGFPWNEKPSDHPIKDLNEFIKEEKKRYSFETLCMTKDGKPLNHLILYMKYCTELQFNEEPNYQYLKSLFKVNESIETDGYSL